jgi:hypothetical protein
MRRIWYIKSPVSKMETVALSGAYEKQALLELECAGIKLRKTFILLIGVTGFEPATSASRRQRSTRLSHTPNTTLKKTTDLTQLNS